MASSSKKKDQAPTTEATVRAYLIDNPDFLQNHPDLLRLLAPPSRFGDTQGDSPVVDMQGFMVSRLQADLARAQDTRSAMIDTARANLASQQQVHDAALAAITARDLDDFIDIVTRRFPRILQVDRIALCVERMGSNPPQAGSLTVLDKGRVDDLMGPDRNLVLREQVQDPADLFAGDGEPVRSDALVRLQLTGTAPPAMLALGSHSPGHFHPGQGTELLGFLTRVLEACLKRWLDLPPV